MNLIKCNLVIVAILILLTLIAKNVYGQTNSSSVNATVRISVCGNGTVEGGEDCENANLNGNSCTSLGYGGGRLICDISCSLDTTACIAPIPTSAPISTPTPTPSVSSTAAPTSASLIATPTQIPFSLPTPALSLPPSSVIPEIVNYYDPNKDGKIERAELFETLEVWVKDWKEYLATINNDKLQSARKCDFNGNESCDIRDFSILLYYVER